MTTREDDPSGSPDANQRASSLANRSSAEEKPSGWSNCAADPTKCWKQTFKYDRYGNRNFNTTGTNTTTLPANFDPDIYNPTIDTDDNRFEAGQGYSYDAAGNTTRDPESRKFTYDAESKQTKVETVDGSGNPIATVGEYFYDGDGKRVKKVVPGGETTIFVYDAGGKLIGEYSTIVQPVQDAKTVYTTNDHLGSPRINTDATGQVISRHDYHPFGEEIARTGYGSDTIRKQFTGYERDGETGLDYAKARYFHSALGRFHSADGFEKDSSLEDGQSWNKYIYVRNNPLTLADPSGEKAEFTVKVDEKRKTGTIVIKASFALYKQSGKFSKAEWKKEVDKFKDQVTKSYTSSKVSKGGITYSISTDFTFKERETEAAAETSGSDNIVGLVKAGSMDLTKPGHGTSNLFGTSYQVAGESFDRILMVTGSPLGNLGGHETGHAFGAADNRGNGIMSGIPNTTAMSDDDFDLIFKQQAFAQESTVGLRSNRLVNGQQLCRHGGCSNPFTYKVRAPETSASKYNFVPRP